ncbi:hypothetical protein CLV35_2676 [Motilibacter peucedani]|uniref:PET hydrolase/cutinase-like domain-containing protein n=1 Tax=Motilibacter peucedani TaxID=598650 RepID=A0A420XMG4_9ACTN|nr:hypothetical protein [Motilibacter peucedani]RKS72432.1 hypothetical protein CLV35_2676 [Motilibacter peucedani]
MTWTAPVRRRAVVGALSAGLMVASATAALNLPASAAEASAAPAASARFSVAATAGGYRVTLHLDSALEARDALPEVAVDGTVIGTASVSADGRTVSAVTSDASVASASSAEVAYDGVVPSAAGARAKMRTVAPAAPAPLTSAAVLADDPATPGPYVVSRADYDFGDTATTLPGLGGRYNELRGAVYLPTGATGKRPVVIFLHGRHSACYNPTTLKSDNSIWPCAPGFQPINSYLGYTEQANALASHGYVVVSISADGINAQDAPYTDDAGTAARGQLVLQTLDLLDRWNDGKGDKKQRAALTGRLDLTTVGLMGHSRGGEGVVEAALQNAALHHPYGIKAVFPLAPIDFARETLPDVPMAVMLPYCDGDVSNQQGQHYYDDSRYAHADDVLRSSLMVMGADHNFFNTEWTPGVSTAPSNDDWSAADDSVCGTASPTSQRLAPAAQRAVGTAYIDGFFRMVLGGEKQFLPLFDGSGSTVRSTGSAAVYTEAQQPGSQRLDVAPLEAAASNVKVSGFATGAYCASSSVRVTQGSGTTPCFTLPQTSRSPHFTPASYAGWVPISPVLKTVWTDASVPASVRATLPAGSFDVSRFSALTFRAALEENQTGPADMDVTVVDGRGTTQSVSVSSVSPALTPFPASTNTPNGLALLPKTWMRTVRIPLSSLTSLDLHDVREVRLTPRSATGGAYLSDLAFDTPGVGAGGPSTLPQLSIADASVDEGNAPGYAAMTISLSDKLKAPASAWLSVVTGTTQLEAQAIPVQFPVGARSVTVQVPLLGNTTPEATPVSVNKIGVSAPKGVLLDDEFAALTIRDDDAVVAP